MYEPFKKQSKPVTHDIDRATTSADRGTERAHCQFVRQNSYLFLSISRINGPS